jgi:endonuclease-3
MATPNRAALIAKIHKVLKKHYSPVHPDLERPVLEQLLFACCLENAHYGPANEAYQALQTTFFDWNEVRVSTVSELAEIMQMLPEPTSSATNLRRILQSVFESTYEFSLEALRKLNLGPAVERLRSFQGVTPFVQAYVTQASLGGHAIPLDRGTLETLAILGLINEAERAEGNVPGLERAVAKNKGFEFASLLHQLGADLVANPYSTALHKLLLEIAPESKERLPKRPPKKPAEEEPAARPAESRKAKSPNGEVEEKAAGKKRPIDKKSDPSEKKPAPRKKAPAAPLSKRKPR